MRVFINLFLKLDNNKLWGCSSVGEHRVRNAGVVGSNPIISIIFLLINYHLRRGRTNFYH